MYIGIHLYSPHRYHNNRTPWLISLFQSSAVHRHHSSLLSNSRLGRKNLGFKDVRFLADRTATPYDLAIGVSLSSVCLSVTLCTVAFVGVQS